MDGFLRILVAEENEIDSFVIQCELSKLDMAFTFKRVASPAEYFSQLQEFHPNLVLANNSFDGAEIIHFTRTTFPNLPVVVIVNTTEESTINSLLNNGATDCLVRRQLPHLKSCVERVIEHCRDHEGEAVPKPTCYEIAIAQKKSFLDRYFGVPTKPVQVTARANTPVEHGTEVSTRGESQMAGTSLGTKLARIKNKFRTTLAVGAGGPALEARKEIQSVLAGTHVATAAAIGTGGGFPVNPSIAGAGSSLLLDGIEVPTIPSPFGSRTDLERNQLPPGESELVKQNGTPERERSDLAREVDVSLLALTLDQNLSILQNDLNWITEQLSRADDEVSRKQLLNVLNSMKGTIGESVRGIQDISYELARWAPTPQNSNAEKKRIL